MKKVFILSALLLFACSTNYQNQKIQGTEFPSVKGTSLSGQEYSIPEDMKGSPTLLLVGYKQDSQFDIDRWLIGLDMKKVDVAAYEVPTIQGMLPRMFSTKIDAGMRKGIPKELWKGVITVYEDGEKVQEFTGNTLPNNTRVVLLDSHSKIIYFNDEGFSVAGLNALIQALDQSK